MNLFRWSRLTSLSLLVLLVAVSGASGSAQAAGAYDEVVFEGSEATVGPGGVLASAAACFNTADKDISGFRMAFDMDDPWATDGNATSVDFQGVATHEMGHVVGIDHTNAPASSCLTMYKFSSLGETQKRTLGLGDKLGMDALYCGGDTTPGPGCNN